VINSLIGNKSEAVKECDAPIITWLAVYSATLSAHVIRKVILAVVLKKSSKPMEVQAKIELFFLCTLFHF